MALPNMDSAPPEKRRKWIDILRRDGVDAYARAIIGDEFYIREEQLRPFMTLHAEIERLETEGDVRGAILARTDAPHIYQAERRALEFVRAHAERAKTASPGGNARLAWEDGERQRLEQRERWAITEGNRAYLAAQEAERQRHIEAARKRFDEMTPQRPRPETPPQPTPQPRPAARKAS